MNMTQNEKDMLMKDLSARLPYKVYTQIVDENESIDYTAAIENIDIDGFITDFEGNQIEIEYIRPYLFPMSSMTDEQKKYIADRWGAHLVTLSDVVGYLNWLIKNHFDVNGLIPMGLAIDATGKNIY